MLGYPGYKQINTYGPNNHTGEIWVIAASTQGSMCEKRDYWGYSISVVEGASSRFISVRKSFIL